MKFKVYKDASGEWRWRLVARNGRIIADCSEGYKGKAHCIRVLDSVRRATVTVVNAL